MQAVQPASLSVVPSAMHTLFGLAVQVLRRNAARYALWFLGLGLAAGYATVLTETPRSANLQTTSPLANNRVATPDVASGNTLSRVVPQDAQSSTSVIVNGQNVPPDNNGDVHTVVPLEHGNASVTVTTDSASSSTSSINVHIYSDDTSTEVDMQSDP